MCEGSFLPSSFGPHQKHTEFESSLRSYPIHSCVFCKGGYLEIRPAVDGLGSQGPWHPPFENHKGWGSLQSGRDPKGGPARPAGQVSAQNPARTWGTLLVSLVRYPLAS